MSFYVEVTSFCAGFMVCLRRDPVGKSGALLTSLTYKDKLITLEALLGTTSTELSRYTLHALLRLKVNGFQLDNIDTLCDCMP